MAKTNYQVAVTENRKKMVQKQLESLGAKNISNGKDKFYNFYVRFTTPNELVDININSKFSDLKKLP